MSVLKEINSFLNWKPSDKIVKTLSRLALIVVAVFGFLNYARPFPQLDAFHVGYAITFFIAWFMLYGKDWSANVLLWVAFINLTDELTGIYDVVYMGEYINFAVALIFEISTQLLRRENNDNGNTNANSNT